MFLRSKIKIRNEKTKKNQPTEFQCLNPYRNQSNEIKPNDWFMCDMQQWTQLG